MADDEEMRDEGAPAADLKRVGIVTVLLTVILGAMYASAYEVPARWRTARSTRVEVTLLDFRNDHEPDAVLSDPEAVHALARGVRWRRVLRPVEACIPWQWQLRCLAEDGNELARVKGSGGGKYAANEESGALYHAAGSSLAQALRELDLTAPSADSR